MITPDDNLLDYVDDYVHGLLSAEDAEIVERFCESSRLGQVALDEARGATKPCRPCRLPRRPSN
jgi:hypothetical protein